MVRLPYIRCEKSHKRRYDSRTACLYDNADLKSNSYRCPTCGGWHLTRSSGMKPSHFEKLSGGTLLYAGLASKRFEAAT